MLCSFADFLWGQGSLALSERGQHCFALAGLAFHASIILQMNSHLQYDRCITTTCESAFTHWVARRAAIAPLP